MKRIVSLILVAIMLLAVAGCVPSHSDDPVMDPDIDPAADPVATARAWIETQMENDTLFSFDYDGVAYAEHIKKWEKTVENTDTGYVLTYKNGDVTAWSEIIFDEEQAAVEWTNYFKNEGSSDSPVISNIQAADTSVRVTNPVFTTAEPSAPGPTEFQPIMVDLVQAESYSMKTDGGRSSQGAWPYFDLSNGEYGVIGGIGWTGDWAASFAHDNGIVSIKAGMQATRIALHAGEDMRTPMYMLQFFVGDQDAGHNAFRRLMLSNYTPIDDETGEPLSHGMTFIGIDATKGEDAVLKTLQEAQSVGREFECMWIDATWYGDLTKDNVISDGAWARQVGNWYFMKDGYPNGNMRKVSDWLHAQGKEVLVWFEPERAIPGTLLTVEHPEWFLYSSNTDNFWLYDFSNDEACDYMIQWISDIIAENRITWYRQDFNCQPNEKWRSHDAKLGENRTGITEIKYITNLYRFWDGLVENNPGLMIDSCASGGLRLDLEAMSRSIPFWHSDLTTDTKFGHTPSNIRSSNYSLTWWLPIHGGFMGNYSADPQIELHNLRGGIVGSNASISSSRAYTRIVAQAVDEYYTCRELKNGDYYMLAYGMDDGIETEPACYEFYKPEEGKGYIICFNPAESTTTEDKYILKGLDADATYELEIVENGVVLTMTGEELMTEGLGVHYPATNFSILIWLNKVN